MRLTSILLLASLASAAPSRPQSAAVAHLFQGNSVVIQPSNTSQHPADATIWAANFYCYFTEKGYFGFGWWLAADSTTNHTHCKPNSPEFDWYEYSSEANCTSTSCRFHAVNFNSDGSLNPDINTDYFVRAPADIGSGDIGTLAVSYFDKENGGYAVGTRRVLSETVSGTEENDECHAAYRTLQKVQQKSKLPLPFQLKNPCPGGSSYGDAQQVLGEF